MFAYFALNIGSTIKSPHFYHAKLKCSGVTERNHFHDVYGSSVYVLMNHFHYKLKFSKKTILQQTQTGVRVLFVESLQTSIPYDFES